MNLIQSICCFFSGRCADGATKPKTDNDGHAHDAASGSASPDRPATDAGNSPPRRIMNVNRGTTKSVRRLDR